MKWIDLHTHSTFSDGTLSPAELLELAGRRGLGALALTDHDTVAGLDEFFAQAAARDFKVIGGIEISAWYQESSLHILGYGLNHHDPALLAALAEIQQARHHRNLGILDKLEDLGIKVPYQKITGQENGQVGRPHIARELIRLGVVHDMHHAFVRYLRKGACAYVESLRIHALDAIRLIRAAGGVPVLAHPAVFDASLAGVEELLPELIAAGLAGLEVYYPAHSHRQHRRLLQLATENGLIATGGTDFHEVNNGAPLGGSPQTVRVPFSCFDELHRQLNAGAEQQAR